MRRASKRRDAIMGKVQKQQPSLSRSGTGACLGDAQPTVEGLRPPPRGQRAWSGITPSPMTRVPERQAPTPGTSGSVCPTVLPPATRIRLPGAGGSGGDRHTPPDAHIKEVVRKMISQAQKVSPRESPERKRPGLARRA
ncbi:hypothetical protein E2I00_011495 [Balaenoptera physalus]|uniref:Uncharacterized protein n=1 Tax=Balaenoptera physalus TaxID=9770 RepID=A0A6A1PYZ6_BALPH|nr:hypothetical protein E2I00_011495 [Balaenoptera physalus]